LLEYIDSGDVDMMSFPNLQYIEALVLALRILIKIGPGGEVEPA